MGGAGIGYTYPRVRIEFDRLRHYAGVVRVMRRKLELEKRGKKGEEEEEFR